jgi:hypothetical protein
VLTKNDRNLKGFLKQSFCASELLVTLKIELTVVERTEKFDHRQMTDNIVRLNVCKATNQKESKLVIVNRNDWDNFLQQASNKLRIKVKRVFNQYGEELTANDLQNSQKIINNMMLIVTTGAEFRGNKKVPSVCNFSQLNLVSYDPLFS